MATQDYKSSTVDLDAAIAAITPDTLAQALREKGDTTPTTTRTKTKRRTSAARRNADMANLRDDMLEASRAAGSLQAAHLLGVLS